MTEAQDGSEPGPEADESPAEPYRVDPSNDPTPGAPGHLAPDDVGPREWVDASKDPTPGVPGHAAPEDDEG